MPGGAARLPACPGAGVGTLWSRPRLQRPPGKVLLRVPKLIEWLCGAIGIALFAIVAYAGLAGEQNLTSNLAPTFIYVIFWVGIPLASAFVGDIFRALNPWRAVGRLAGWLLTNRRSASADRERGGLLGSYPSSWGRWPAAATRSCSRRMQESEWRRLAPCSTHGSKKNPGSTPLRAATGARSTYDGSLRRASKPAQGGKRGVLCTR